MIGLRFDRVGEALAHRRSRRHQSEWRALGDFLGERERGIAQVVALYELIAQPPRQRLFTLDAAAREEHQAGFLHTDQTRERVGEAEAGVDANLHEVAGEAGVSSCDAEVGDQRESEAPTDCWSLNRGDDRLFASEQSHALDVQWILTSARGRLAAARVAIGKVRACTK